MSRSCTVTMTKEQIDDFHDRQVIEEARKSLSADSPFWKGVEWFIDWFRNKVKNFLQNRLSDIPVIGKWASRISVTITEFGFTVVGTLCHFLKTVFCAPTTWKKAHEAAMRAWNENANNGLLAQTYAYGKKMASYFLEIIKQCLERAIKAHGLEVSSDERDDISATLDQLLD